MNLLIPTEKAIEGGGPKIMYTCSPIHTQKRVNKKEKRRKKKRGGDDACAPRNYKHELKKKGGRKGEERAFRITGILRYVSAAHKSYIPAGSTNQKRKGLMKPTPFAIVLPIYDPMHISTQVYRGKKLPKKNKTEQNRTKQTREEMQKKKKRKSQTGELAPVSCRISIASQQVKSA